MNQKGIVLSGLIYALLVFFLLLLVTLLSVMWYRQNALNSLKDDANDIYDEEYIPELLLTSRFEINAGAEGTYTLKQNSNYFSGSNPNNWIEFGTIDGNKIIWRVIKSDPEGIKIIYEGIKNDGNIPIDNGRITIGDEFESSWDGTNINKWERPSDLSSALNTWYNGLADISNYVQPINWCIGAVGNNPTIDDFASGECLAQTSSGGTFGGRITTPLVIGMLKPSDYISTSGTDTCNAYNQTECGTSNYLSKNYDYWTLNAYLVDTSNVWSILNDGSINYTSANNTISVRPVINLSNDVKWDSGNGTIGNPYKIK